MPTSPDPARFQPRSGRRGINSSWWFPMLALVFVATPMLFPTGRLPSARWRPVAAVAAVAAVALELLAALQPTIKLQDENYRVDNPIGLAWFPDPETSPVGGALAGLLTACIVAAVISLVLRFRRARGVERQQLKWFVYAGVLLILTILVGAYLPAAIGDALFGLIIAFVPSRSASRSCATGCSTSTGSSTARWSTAC